MICKLPEGPDGQESTAGSWSLRCGSGSDCGRQHSWRGCTCHANRATHREGLGEILVHLLPVGDGLIPVGLPRGGLFRGRLLRLARLHGDLRWFGERVGG